MTQYIATLSIDIILAGMILLLYYRILMLEKEVESQ